MLDDLGLATEAALVEDYLSETDVPEEVVENDDDKGLTYYLEMMKPELDEASTEDVVSLIKSLLQYV